VKLAPVTTEAYSQRDPETTVTCLAFPSQKRTPLLDHAEQWISLKEEIRV